MDHYLIQEMNSTSLKLHVPTKTMRPKSPLPLRHMVTVIKDAELYRAWYRGTDPSYTGDSGTGNAGEVVFYAESQDGHEWQFPKLRLHEIGGTFENNAILAKMPPFLTNFVPFLDTRPGVPATERYKAVAGYPGPGNKLGTSLPGMGLFGFVSPDGITWTKQQEIIPYRPEWRHAFDSPNVAFWSEAEQLYVCYFRTWTEPDGLRTISRATSPDFVSWSVPVAMMPNLPGEHLYTSMTQPYARAPHIYIALPTRFTPGFVDGGDGTYENLTDVLFMSTRAGSTFYSRPFLEAYLRPGPDPARWVNRANYVANNVLQTGPSELSIYHRSGDRFVLRLDGFVSVNAGAAEGTLLLRPLVYAGSKLELNFSTSTQGWIVAEILALDGSVLARSKRLIGDSINRVVAWGAADNVSLHAGRTVRLRFTMRDADLYALRFIQ